MHIVEAMFTTQRGINASVFDTHCLDLTCRELPRTIRSPARALCITSLCLVPAPPNPSSVQNRSITSAPNQRGEIVATCFSPPLLYTISYHVAGVTRYRHSPRLKSRSLHVLCRQPGFTVHGHPGTPEVRIHIHGVFMRIADEDCG